MVYCVGLTGTIASGKSTIAAFFKSHGITVISADEIARQLVHKGLPAFNEIKKHFGDKIISSSGEINRKLLRELIIHDVKDRKWLEQELHPRIRKQIEAEVIKVSSPYCVIEIPLLKNRSDYPYLNRTLLIVTKAQTAIKRVVIRDNCNKKDVTSLLSLQIKNLLSQDEADDIIINNDSIEALLKKTEEQHQHYLALSGHH